MFEDIDGDGRPEWIVNSWKKDCPMMVYRLVEKSNEKQQADAAESNKKQQANADD